MNVLKPVAWLVVAVVTLGWFTLYTVDERELAIEFRFGEIIRMDMEPGLHFKWPWHNVQKHPRRILTILNPQEQFLTSDKKNLLVDFFVKWQITDVGQFYRATGGDERAAAQRLIEIVKDGIRAEFARRDVVEVVSAERRELMRQMMERAGISAEELGARVVDVRIKRIEFPDDVLESVFSRMRQERARVAAELRAEGAEIGEEIRADADRQVTIILAEAFREAERVRGAGDARAAQIYASAFNQDPEFYSFFRSIQAYRNSLGRDSDLLVIGTESEFFRYLNQANPGR
ncbi:MAG: protease modulator HflC [Chromatiales bacterium]|nr:protease modulator HflC [Chromatiales bacterium]